MYHEFYGLNRMPFQGSPDPDFLYPGPTHREALATIEYGVEAGMGFILLTGEVGLGKTTLIRTFLKRAANADLFVIYVFHPLLSFDELLAVMAEELELDLAERQPYQLMRSIQRNLIARFEAGQRVVLIIDEAHRLPEETLENLRLVSNLETDDAKLLQIVIVGQPELEALLALPRLRQLNQRITLRAKLQPLSRDDSIAYIRHRLQQAGAVAAEDAIATDAIREIARRSGGVPRHINNLATLALIHGFGVGERPIRARRVRGVAPGAETTVDLPPTALRPRRRGWRWAFASILIVLGALGAAAAVLFEDGAARAWLAQYTDVSELDQLAAKLRNFTLATTTAVSAPSTSTATTTAPIAAPGPAAEPPAATVAIQPAFGAPSVDTTAAAAPVPVIPPISPPASPPPDDSSTAARDPVPSIVPQVATVEPPLAAPPPPVPSAEPMARPIDDTLRTAQLALIRLGYDPGSADGIMGPLTVRALSAFQHDRTLAETGTLTPETMRNLSRPN